MNRLFLRFISKFLSYKENKNPTLPNMKRIISIALLIAGVLLLYFGYQEYNSLGSELGQAFGGSDSTEAIWMLIAGAVAAVIGGAGLLRKE